MMQNTGRLELTWIGKYDEKIAEPRILIEKKDRSYGDPKSKNMLIHGDNMLALKSLEQNYSEKIKCVYIDPPFNTGEAFDNYDDNIEESLWLSLMKQRLEIIKNLLTDDGTLFVHIDAVNLGYLLVLLDEIFLRSNRLYVITFKQGSATGHKAINPGCVSTTNFILMYAKDKKAWNPNRVFTARERDARYGSFIVNRNEDYSEWKICTLMEAYADSMMLTIKEARKIIKKNPEFMDKFVLEHSESVIRLAQPDYKSVGEVVKEAIDDSKKHPNSIVYLSRENYSDMYFIGGQRILFYRDKLKCIDGKWVAGEPLTTLWDDILSNNLHKEGEISFPKGKKPEHLLKRVLELSTNPGDWVLDSFLGSGTTAAVAHKMGRQWIGIEMGEQAYTHCKIRMDKVVDGEQGGISKTVAWNGGGGYHFYELAPSLLVKNDKLPVYQINPTYTFEMLCEAICKIEGFRYEPQDVFHGHSSEQRFIHITKEFVNPAYVKAMAARLTESQSLMIYATKTQSDMILPDFIEVKKIPKNLLEKCDFESEAE